MEFLPESSTIHAGIFFGCLVIAWGLLAGYLTPHQPFANRNSILLEICVRDLAISLPIAMLGLPALSLTEKLEVVAAELVASPDHRLEPCLALLLLAGGEASQCRR